MMDLQRRPILVLAPSVASLGKVTSQMGLSHLNPAVGTTLVPGTQHPHWVFIRGRREGLGRRDGRATLPAEMRAKGP